MGILLADCSNGPFKFEVQYIRGVTEFDVKDYAVATQARAILQLGERDRATASGSAESSAEASRSREAVREYQRQQREKSRLQ